MMPFAWSTSSRESLTEVDQRLKEVFNKALELGLVDITIIEGHRSRARQEEMVRTGKSQVHWPHSKHNAYPSKAADAMAYPIDWNNSLRNAMFSGYIIGIAAMMGIKVRAGADWDGDFNPKNNWQDFPHFEIDGE